MIEKDFITTLEEHTKEDKIQFDRFNASISKLNEQMLINGEHMSYIRRDLTELMTLISDMKPMLKSYQDSEATNRTLVHYGKSIVFIGAIIGALVTIGGGIIYVIKKSL